MECVIVVAVVAAVCFFVVRKIKRDKAKAVVRGNPSPNPGEPGVINPEN